MSPIKKKPGSAAKAKAIQTTSPTGFSGGTGKIMVLKSRLSEKAYGISKTENNYVFVVPTAVNKQAVAQAVAAQFGVKVVAVNVMNVKGKAKRTVKRGGRATAGQRSNTKKAYVKLQAGDSLPIFAAEEKAEADATKASQKEKK